MTGRGLRSVDEVTVVEVGPVCQCSAGQAVRVATASCECVTSVM